VKRLTGMMLEAQGKIKEADEMYRKILEADPANQIAMKRQISIRKSQGDVMTAIKMLNDYLKIFVTDSEAWHELGDLYLSQQMYKNAAFCHEELILSFPQNFHFFIKYGEILYTIGGYDNFKNARKNFAYAFELSPASSNIRALYGLLMSAIAVASTSKGKQEQDNQELLEWAYTKLQNIQSGRYERQTGTLEIIPEVCNGTA